MENMIEPIDRVAIDLGPIQLYWYGVIIIAGALLGLWLAMRESERRDLPKETFADLVIYAFPVSIIFARIYYVIFKWEYYAEHPIKIFAIREGGLAMHGVLFGAVLSIIVFAKVRQNIVLETCRHFGTKPDFGPGNWTLGKFYQPGSPRWTCIEGISRKSVFARLYH